MRSYIEQLRFLMVREQLALGWKIGLFIVCGALLYGSMTLMDVNIRSVDVNGTVTSHQTETLKSESATYLIVQLDRGDTVRAKSVGSFDYRAGQRAVVREITTNFFGLKKYVFKGYIEKPHAG
jgi:hypothetical protein